MRQFGRARRIYHFTPQITAELHEAYRSRNKREMSAQIGALARWTGWPRHAFLTEAIRLGISRERRAWSPEEDEHLRERIGSQSLSSIASHLGRSVGSVMARAERIHLSRRLSEGYCSSDLAQCFGVHISKIGRWMARGLFGKVHSTNCGWRVTERNVAHFIRRYPQEYDLRRVDQVWFMSMVFGREV